MSQKTFISLGVIVIMIMIIDHLYDDQLGEKAAPRLAQSRPSSSVCSSTSSFYHFPIVYENELDDDTCQGYDILPPSLPFCNASGSEDT